MCEHCVCALYSLLVQGSSCGPLCPETVAARYGRSGARFLQIWTSGKDFMKNGAARDFRQVALGNALSGDKLCGFAPRVGFGGRQVRWFWSGPVSDPARPVGMSEPSPPGNKA